MAQYRTTHVTATPIERAFDFLSRFSTTQDWDPGVVAAEDLTPGPVGVGSAYRVVARFLGRDVPLRYEIVEFERPRSVTLSAENSSVRSTDTMTFVANDDGTTTITYDARLDPKGLGRLAGPLLALAFGRIGDRAAAGLRRAVDAIGATRTDHPT